MSSLLGMCIDNTNEMSLTISVTLNVQEAMRKIGEIMGRQAAQEEEMQESEAKIQNLTENIKQIRETYNKLLEDRAKAKTTI